MDRKRSFILFFSIFFFTQSAHALLIDNGDNTITDTDTNLMWVKSLNLTDELGVDDALYGRNTNGALRWSDAIAWVDGLDYAGYSDWRLPVADASCFASGNLAFNCLDSEMGEIYYNSLGNVAQDRIVNLGPFTNAPGFLQFWSSTEYDANSALDFHLSGGGQHPYNKNAPTNVWAVRDISATPQAVPLPGTIYLMMAGGIGVLVSRRRKHQCDYL